MLKKTVALAALAAAFVVAPAATAVADPYSPGIPTETLIEVTVGGPGDPVVVHVKASANTATPPEGDISLEISASGDVTPVDERSNGAGKPPFRTTVHFEGEPLRIVGPRLPKGTYLATAEFAPDNPELYGPSEDRVRFRVDAGGGQGGPGRGDRADLPNTGGPSVMWLILGTGLVAAGSGGVGYGRRRQSTT